MPERDGYLPGVPCWIDTSQPDPGAAVEFYSGLFGWDFEDVMPPGSDGSYFIARLRGGDVAAVSSHSEGAPPLASWNTYIWVESADEASAKVPAAGGRILMEPFDVWTRDGWGSLRIPRVPSSASGRRHRGAQIVNEHGSLNFNGLHTRDAEGARSFYGSVFGWKTLTWTARSVAAPRAMATISNRVIRSCANGSRSSAPRPASRTWSPRSTRSARRNPMFPRTGA